MNINELPLGDEFKMYIREKLHVHELYDVQADAVKSIFEDKNVVISVPTASGKSLIGYIAMMKGLEAMGKVMYIAPFKAIAVEKYHDLKDLNELGISVVLGTGDYQYISKKLRKADVKILTIEKADSMLIKDISIANEVSVVVIDELHFIGDEERGPIIEMFLTKLLLSNPDIQIVGLSATIPNAVDMANWLSKFKDTEVIESNKRRVPLEIGCYEAGELCIKKNYIRVGKGKFGVDALVKYILDMNKQVIVFVSTRKQARALAIKLAKELSRYTDFQQRLFVNNLKSDYIARGKEVTSTIEDLFECMNFKVAFHHAGLDIDTRMMIEELYREGHLNVLVSTSTLSAGVNLPAFAVIVRDMHKVKMENGHYISVPIPVNDLLQYVGRAGRPKYDKEGWGIFMIKSRNDARLYRDVINFKMQDIESHLNNPRILRRQILSLIGMNLIGTVEDLDYIFENTFYGSVHSNIKPLMLTSAKDIKTMLDMALITNSNGVLHLTELSRWIVKMYLDPFTAYYFLYIIKFLDRYDYFSLLFAFGISPDAPMYAVNKNDVNELIRIAEEYEVPVSYNMIQEEDNYARYLSGIKIASVLWDWINEVPLETIEEKWNVQEGDLNALRSTASWVFSSIRIIIENNAEFKLDRILEKLYHIELRVRYGVPEELVDLIMIKYVGRKRARLLFDAGYKTVQEVAYAKPYDLMKIKGIGKKIAEKIIANAKALLQLRK